MAALPDEQRKIQRLPSTKQRPQARHLKKALQIPTAIESICSPFTIRELDTTIRVIRSPDDILPTFLKALGQMAKADQLSIFNGNSPFHALVYINVSFMLMPVAVCCFYCFEGQ